MPESAPSSDSPEPKKRTKPPAQIFLTTFTTVFLAELGDKTQLAALLFPAESGRPVLVFIGPPWP